MRDGIPLGEKHTVFGLSAMVGISITLLVRDPDHIGDTKILDDAADGGRRGRKSSTAWRSQLT